MKRLWMTCAILLSVAGAARAERVFRIVGPGAAPTPRTLVAGAVERHTIELDDAALARNPERLTFALPDGRTVDVERARHLVHGPDLESWSGTVPSFDPAREHASYVRFSRRPSGITGVVALADGERFEILPDGRDHQLVRIEGAAGAPAACGVPPDPVPSATVKPAAAPAPSLEPPAPMAELAIAPPPTTIDLLAVYSDRFLTSEPEPTMRAYVQDSIIDANEIFWNSGVNAQYNLRYLGPLTGAQPPLTGIRNDLGWLNTTNSAELHGLRAAYGADMVVLFVPLSDSALNACGIANLRLSNGCLCEGLTGEPRPAFDQRAFSVVRSGCGLTDFTVAHELGHNYGMGHGPEAFADIRFPYARGFIIQPQVSATAMACTGYTVGEDIVNGVCNRIPYFSDPALTVGNLPIGSDNHDNARVAEEQVGPYAGFWPTRTTGVPTVRITAPARNATFTRNTNVTFTATASDPEQGNLAASIRWRVDGVLVGGAGATFVRSFATDGAHTVTATVTDASNVAAEWSVPITIVPPPASTGFYWITPAEVAGFGAPGTLTVAGFARDGAGGVQLRWRDATAAGSWAIVPYQPAPDSNGTWFNSIPAPINRCHTYQAQSFYSGAQSSVFSWNGLSSGYCTETARVIWIQPQPLAGFGPPGSLVVAGEARNAPAGYGVRLSYRNVTLNGPWTELSYAPAPDMTGIWYNAIPGATFTHRYAVRVTYDVITSSTCTYAGTNSLTWC